jgi:predicted nucleic acid-binding protein
MTTTLQQRYCLDANVLINAWNKYYSPRFCPDYWKLLDELGKQDRIFLPQLVFEEITRTEDDLCKWLKSSKIPVHQITEPVTQYLKNNICSRPFAFNAGR